MRTTGTGFSSEEQKLKVWRAFSRAVAEMHRHNILRNDLDAVHAVIYDPTADTVTFPPSTPPATLHQDMAPAELARNLVPLMQLMLARKDTPQTERLWTTFREVYLQTMDERGAQVMAELQSIQSQLAQASNLTLQGLSQAYLGQTEEAIKSLHRSLEVREGVGDHEGYCRTLCNLALVYADAKDMTKALQTADLAIQWGEQHGRVKGLCLALLQKALLLNRVDRRAEALAHVERALKEWRTTRQPLPSQFNAIVQAIRSGHAVAVEHLIRVDPGADEDNA